MTRLFSTIKFKFIFLTLILILLSVGIPSVFLINQFKENFEQRSKVMIYSTLDVVLRLMYDKMMTSDKKDVQASIDEIAGNESVNVIRIFSESGKILYSTDRNDIGKSINDIASHQLDEINLDKTTIARLNHEGMFSTTEPINNKPECQQCHGDKGVLAYLDIDTNLTQAETYFYTGRYHFIFLAIVIAIVLFFIFYIVFNRLVNNPLIKFNNSMKAVEEGNLDIQLPIKNNDEIGVLKERFNRMVRNLKQSQEKIQEMHFDQLRHADKLITLGELAAEMAHEINNPAAIIMSRADYLQMMSENNFNLKEYIEDLDVILKQTHRISKITGNILKYSKKLPKDFQKIELIQIINESLKILEPRFDKKNIKVKKEYAVDEASIIGDAVQIEQVLTNLVNNAIDAMDIGGELILKVNRINDNKFIFSISDNGHGIEEYIREKIFSPFFTTKSGNKGTGLGLYIVKNICNNHSAEIICNSSPGIGTTFKIIFNKSEV